MMLASLPTTDLYFLNSCRPWVRRPLQKGPVTRDGANSFNCGDRFLLIRRDESELMEKALRWRGRLIYVIDDDIAGAALSPGLPASYRAKLAEFKARYHDRLLQRADTIGTSSDVLVERFKLDPLIGADIIRMDPFWACPLADQSHFALSPKGHLEIAHLGTASHSSALAKIAPAVKAALDRFPFAHFSFVGCSGDHPELEAHERVRRHDVMGWPRYRRWLPRQRYHLALYPLEQTPFDRARSANKIFEHAIIGAAAIYPRDWSPAAMVGGGAIFAPEDPRDWKEALFNAIEQRMMLGELAKAAMTAVERHHEGVTQRQTWATLLNLDVNTLKLR